MAHQIRTNSDNPLVRMLLSIKDVVSEYRGEDLRIVWISPTYKSAVEDGLHLYTEGQRRNDRTKVDMEKLRVTTRIWDKNLIMHFVPATQPERMLGHRYEAVFIQEDVLVTQDIAMLAAQVTKEPLT